MRKYWQDWVNYFLGLWVFGSPWFIERAMVSTERGGGTRGMLNLGGRARRGAALDAGDQRIMTAWDQRAIFALGAWLLLSPWIIGFAATVPLMWNSVIFGGLIFAFAGWRLIDDRRRRPP